jgi:hypothetical protein
MVEHDPIDFVKQLAGQLAARSRHVCALLGAGAARACGLPDLAGLQQEVADRLPGDKAEVYVSLLDGHNLEEVLTRLRRLQEVLTGDQKLDGLTDQAAGDLDRAICQAITEALELDDADRDPMLAFARWILRAQYHSPVEVFTLNYDLLLEDALDSLRALYFDGFVGTVRARFQTELVEAPAGSDVSLPASFARLWKLHGSVNWVWSDDPPEVVRLGAPVPEGLAAAIYPSDAKYEESRRVPFVVLMDRFRRALLQPETLLLVTGYSFEDQHVNELIFDAAARRERSSFIAFCFDDIPQNLVDIALATPAIVAAAEDEAVWGGVRAPWKSDEDLPGVFEDDRLRLADFRNLAGHLARGQAADETDA